MYKQAGLFLAFLVSFPVAAETQEYRVLISGEDVGRLIVETDGRDVAIDYDYKDNGRGPTMRETVSLDGDGYPVRWQVSGTATFGNPVDEWFRREGDGATWRDNTGEETADADAARFYVTQNGGPWGQALLARALLADEDRAIPILPGGEARLNELGEMRFEGLDGPVDATVYELTGLALNPRYVVLDGQGRLFATATADFAVVRAGYESADEPLRNHVEQLSTQRFVDIQAETAHRYEGPVRLRDVRIFDPRSLSLSEPVAVVWYGREITGIQPLDAPATPGETVIDGAGGTLVPGMFDMHSHISQNIALLNIAAGVTTVREMGNDNEVIAGLVGRITDGSIAGPRIIRSGFIEGRSPYSSTNGFVVASEEEGLEAVRWYAARGFRQIKLYNSIDPQWSPALIAEAHRLGMRAAGHIPAFSTADEMIAAGYDEITHINQLMLGWVLEEGEDTRTLLRITALDRLSGLDLASAPVRRSLDLMEQNHIAIDPTLAVLEVLLLNRDGQTAALAAPIFDHLPVSERRSWRTGWVDISEPGKDEAYRRAFDQILRAMREIRGRGITILTGTDLGGSFAYHRELELLESLGYSPAEALRLGTLDMARYLGVDQRLGSIERGKLADFFLVPGDPTADLGAIRSIAMVVADGTIYFPSEIYPHFGIRPFAMPPEVETDDGG